MIPPPTKEEALIAAAKVRAHIALLPEDEQKKIAMAENTLHQIIKIDPAIFSIAMLLVTIGIGHSILETAEKNGLR